MRWEREGREEGEREEGKREEGIWEGKDGSKEKK